MTQEQLKTQLTERLNAKCDNPQDQRIHDLLAKFDQLCTDDCHTKACGVGQVWNGSGCNCQGADA